ncbi:MAG: hypothetical protein BroJett018_26480 [Chloroflexota bacterium]|nr:MAG: hypothetical protein BroJett018_26480 [Chloroflexota bacterium]
MEMGKPAEAGWESYNIGQSTSVDIGIVAGEFIPRHSWLTYTFDRAVWMWGQWVESKLAERDAQGRPVNSLEHILSESNPVITESFGGADQLMAVVGEGVRIKP